MTDQQSAPPDSEVLDWMVDLLLDKGYCPIELSLLDDIPDEEVRKICVSVRHPSGPWGPEEWSCEGHESAPLQCWQRLYVYRQQEKDQARAERGRTEGEC